MNDFPFPCRLCGAAIQPQPWGGAECPHCGSVSVRDLPAPPVLEDYYARFVERYSGGGGSGGRNMLRYARRYLQLVARHAGQPGGRLLDVGSSNNPIPGEAAAAGWRTTTIDFVPPRRPAADVQFIAGHLGDAVLFESLSRSFDAVTCWAVLEHVPDPQRAVENLCRVCKRGGLVLVSTPEIGTLLTDHSTGHSAWFFPPEHLHLISPRAMQRLFAPAGFTLRDWGRLELNWARYAARYGIGLAEAAAGAILESVAPMAWRRLRAERTHRFKGITWFAFAAPADSGRPPEEPEAR